MNWTLSSAWRGREVALLTIVAPQLPQNRMSSVSALPQVRQVRSVEVSSSCLVIPTSVIAGACSATGAGASRPSDAPQLWQNW